VAMARSFVRSIRSISGGKATFLFGGAIGRHHDAAYCDNYCGASSDAVLSSEARAELHEHVTTIASTYNFDHAGHVTASTRRLLHGLCARYEDEDVLSVAPIRWGDSRSRSPRSCTTSTTRGCRMHNVTEADPLAIQFHNSSVGEKRSIPIAWNVLGCGR
jgi:hypothetical protein